MPESTAELSFRLISFRALRYSFRLLDDIPVPPKPDQEINFNFKYHFKSYRNKDSNYAIEIGVSGLLSTTEEPLFELTTQTIFAVEGELLNSPEVGSALPGDLVLSFFGMAYASTRGMLAEKTYGAAILPMQNISELLSEKFGSLDLPFAVY